MRHSSRSRLAAAVLGCTVLALTAAPAASEARNPVDDLGRPVDHAPEGLPVPSTATKDLTFGTSSDLENWEVPRGTLLRTLLKWYSKHLPFGVDWSDGWEWCAEVSTRSTRNGNAPYWSWARQANDGTTDSVAVTLVPAENPKKVAGIVIGIIPGAPCERRPEGSVFLMRSR